jgi:phospholipase C
MATTALEQIEHIFILMMENRSFDHMLGYLDLEGHPVMGIADARRAKYANLLNGKRYAPAPRTDPTVPVDPLHERTDIRRQMRFAAGDPMMTGFVADYSTVSPNDPYPVGQFYESAQVWMMDFLAKNFCACDRWFASLPASTQPNRLMSMSGYTLREYSTNNLFEDQENMAYDWLDAQGVSWRVYSEGFPFFALMPKVLKRVISDVWSTHFRGFDELEHDCRSADGLPQVIFIEPQFTNGAQPEKADDDHPLTPITRGEEFLRRVYTAVRCNQEVWSKSVLIITYDEHGGFFDHVQPVAFVTPQNHGEKYPLFTTAGVRVPALIVSPFVGAGSTFHQPLDHTSILSLLADKYTPGQPYSPDVAARRPFHSVAEVLAESASRPGPAPQPPAVPPQPPVSTVPSNRPIPAPNSIAVFTAMEEMRRLDPQGAAHKFPAWSQYFLKGR